MPVNGFTIGRDVTVDIVSKKKGILRFPIRTGFSRKQDVVELKSKGLDGIIRHGTIPDGWSGSFDFDRSSSELDDYIAQEEADYYAGRNSDEISFTETITEANGSITQYRYTGVAMKYTDAGNLAGDSKVTQKVDWMASKRQKIA
ncbi:MAG: hypothetical protein GC190_21900 [Alphaproteobacteria bacterium]|nr:hypothetical protein [Alphaproteobacteria bacterium]